MITLQYVYIGCTADVFVYQVDLNATVVLSEDADDHFESFSSLNDSVNNDAVRELYFDTLQHSADVADTLPCHRTRSLRGMDGLRQRVSPDSSCNDKLISNRYTLRESSRNGDVFVQHGRHSDHPMTDVGDILPCQRSLHPLDGLRQRVSPHGVNYDKPSNQYSSRQSSRNGEVSMNTRHSDDLTSNVTDKSNANSLLNETFSSLPISSDTSCGQSWLTSDLSTVTESDLTMVTALSDSSCFVHSVRIERQPIADNDDERCSLVETALIPTDKIDANTSCQYDNLECSYLSDDRTLLSDWKTASEPDNSDAEDRVTVPDSVKVCYCH